MKSIKQIADRITALESRQKDGIDTKNTVEYLKWAINVREEDVREKLLNSVQLKHGLHFADVRCLLWILEN